MKAISRKDALSSGLPRYFTGRPCLNGHVSERLTANYWCIDCQRDSHAGNSTARHAKQKEWRDANREHVAEYAGRVRPWAKRRAAKLNAVPGWFGELDEFVIEECSTLAVLRESATGIPWEVDHMIPLQARSACGLHCAYNLQVIPAALNRGKHNRMVFTEPFEWFGWWAGRESNPRSAD